MRTKLLLVLLVLLSISPVQAHAADKDPLIPKLEVQIAKETDISLRITNYDDSFTWNATSTAGEVIMDRIGNLSVINLKKGDKATITVTTTKVGYKTGAAVYNGILGQTPTPTPATTTNSNSVVTNTAKPSMSPSVATKAPTTPKAGTNCTKVGLKQNYAGKKFTCIKSGKKLVWDKGVAIKK